MELLNSNGVPRSNKENKHSSPNKEIQKLKIQLNDRIFECHRLEEDFAQERAKLVIDFQKERGQLTKTIKELREKNQADNQQWAAKIDQMRKQKEDALTRLAKEYQRKLNEERSKAKDQIQAQFKKQIHQLKAQIVGLEADLQKNCQKWKKEKDQAVDKLMVEHSKLRDEMNKGYHATVDGIKKDYEERITYVQNLYVKEEHLNRKLQKDNDEKLKEHIKTVLIIQGINAQLTQENQKLKQQIANFNQQIKDLKNHQDNIHRSHQEQRRFTASNHLEEFNQLKTTFQQQKQHIIDIHSQHIQKVKTEMAAMEMVYKEKQKLWDERGKKMLEMYEKRESKKEDVKAIEKLEVQLIKRDFLLERQRNELKYCKLQLQNMEQIYDRMFLSNSNLNKTKTKSFKVKKLKTAIYNSNRSMIENRKLNFEDIK